MTAIVPFWRGRVFATAPGSRPRGRHPGYAAGRRAALTLAGLIVLAVGLAGHRPAVGAEPPAPSAGPDREPGDATVPGAVPDDSWEERGFPSLIRMYDADLDGRLLFSELRKQVGEEFRKRDASRDGYITRDEFTRYFWRVPHVFEDERLETMDRNGDGRISAAEDFADAEALFKCLDKNHDYSVDGEEIELEEEDCFRAVSRGGSRSMASRLRPVEMPIMAFDLDRNRILTGRECRPIIASEFNRRDANRDGWVSFAEYAASTGGPAARAAAHAFRRLDGDGNRRLSPAELQPETDQRFRIFDPDGNGILTEAEAMLLERAVLSGQFGFLPNLSDGRVRR